jgi:flagellar basal body-associated protein FliL
MPDAPEVEPQEKPKRKRKLPKTPVLIGAVMLIEAGGFFAGMKLMGSDPKESYGEGSGHYVEGAPSTQQAEVEVPILTRFRVPNSKSGRSYIYDLDLVVTVLQNRKEEMEGIVAASSATISDAVSMVFRRADPDVLSQDDLTSLRRQLKYVLNEITHDDQLIQRVLIPRMVPLKAD